MGWLLSVYIATTVFGVGVTVIDLFGLIGDHQGGEDSHGGGDHGSDSHAGADDFSVAHADGGHGDDGHDGDNGDDGAHSGDNASVAGHDRRTRRNPVLRILSAARNVVYFALGFGPTGWFAIGTGRSVGSALLWSAGVGLVVLGGARILRRVLRSELSSEIQESDLLMERGTVTVTVNPNALGRVRISLGGTYADRYARSESPVALRPGTAIRVVEIGEDCVIVEPEQE